MAETTVFKNLLARLQAGDHDAGAAVYRQFASRLIALARQKLDPRIREKLDPEDVVQSVFMSFFHRHAGGEYEIQNVESLWGLLSLITIRKCGHKIEHFYAACRDVARESKPQPLDGEASRFWEAIADGPTPSQALLLAETLEGVMRTLDERQRQILTLSLQGYEHPEIAAQLQCSERTVRTGAESARTNAQRRVTPAAETTGPGLRISFLVNPLNQDRHHAGNRNQNQPVHGRLCPNAAGGDCGRADG
jgi:RNA polymerase sigma-70 factor (ECF subfamily)